MTERLFTAHPSNGPEAGSAVPSGGVKKKWSVPEITSSDVLESVAGGCEVNAKANIAACPQGVQS